MSGSHDWREDDAEEQSDSEFDICVICGQEDDGDPRYITADDSGVCVTCKPTTIPIIVVRGVLEQVLKHATAHVRLDVTPKPAPATIEHDRRVISTWLRDAKRNVERSIEVPRALRALTPTQRTQLTATAEMIATLISEIEPT